MRQEYERFKKKLEEEKRSLEASIKSINEESFGMSERERTGELSVVDNHPADTASELFEREKDVVLNTNEKYLLSKVVNALDRMDKGNYGICEDCGKKIEEERLEAIPYAEFCSECSKSHSTVKVTEGEVRYEVLPPTQNTAYKSSFGETSDDVEDALEDAMQPNVRQGINQSIRDEKEDDVLRSLENISNQQYKNTLD